MLHKTTPAALLLIALAGCTHVTPTPLPVQTRLARAAAAADLTITSAGISGSQKPLLHDFTVKITGNPPQGEPRAIELHRFWKPWSGNGFTWATDNGQAVSPGSAPGLAHLLRTATLAPGVSKDVITRAVELLDLIADQAQIPELTTN